MLWLAERVHVIIVYVQYMFRCRMREWTTRTSGSSVDNHRLIFPSDFFYPKVITIERYDPDRRGGISFYNGHEEVKKEY